MGDLSRLKVCFVAGTLGQGGAERQLFYILRCLRENGAAVRLLSLTSGEYWENKIRELGVPVVWVGDKPSRLARLKRIIEELRQDLPGVVQSAHFYTNLYAIVAARRLGLRDVGAIRNDAISEVRANGRILGGLSLRLPRLLAPNSRVGLRNALELGASSSRCHFLPNVVDTDRFRPVMREHRGFVTLLAVGRLVEQKRLDRFLRILAKVRSESAVPVRGLIAEIGRASCRERV